MVNVRKRKYLKILLDEAVQFVSRFRVLVELQIFRYSQLITEPEKVFQVDRRSVASRSTSSHYENAIA